MCRAAVPLMPRRQDWLRASALLQARWRRPHLGLFCKAYTRQTRAAGKFCRRKTAVGQPQKAASENPQEILGNLPASSAVRKRGSAFLWQFLVILRRITALLR